MAGLIAGAILGGVAMGVEKYKSRRAQKARAQDQDLEDDQINNRNSSSVIASSGPGSRSTSRPRHARSKSESDVVEQAVHREGDESDEEVLPPPYDLETQPSYEEAIMSPRGGGSSRAREDVPIDIQTRKEREEERKQRRKDFFDPKQNGNFLDLMGRSMASYHGSGCVGSKQFKYWDDDCMAQEKARVEEKKARKREAKSAARMDHGIDPPKYEDVDIGGGSKSGDKQIDEKKKRSG